MAVAADESGWGGFFLWDHVTFPYPGVPMEDPWVLLGAAAVKTKNVRLGTLVTPLPRRRPQIVAKQLTTLDELSGGRAVLGVGLGGDPNDFTHFGEDPDVGVRADKLDEALGVITALWSGGAVNHEGRHYHLKDATLLPTPVQKPRIPIYVGGEKKGALRRAAKFDGWVPGGPVPAVGFKGLSLDTVKASVEEIKKMRQTDDPFEVLYTVDFPEGVEDRACLVAKAENAGVTWLIENIYGVRHTREKALKTIRAGPPRA
jgi:probable F420-dependent oxidoreductase